VHDFAYIRKELAIPDGSDILAILPFLIRWSPPGVMPGSAR